MQNAAKTKNRNFQLVCSAVPLKEFEWDANEKKKCKPYHTGSNE